MPKRVEHLNMAIHRFKCSAELNDAIILFAQKHKYDEGELLDTQFMAWMSSPAIEAIVENEKAYLARHHYETDISVKIFKSIKYYYIKKFVKPEEKKEAAPRKHHLLPKELKTAIQEDLEKRFAENPQFKPADTFALFDTTGYDFPAATLKKCYKNQYYQLKYKKYAATVHA
jgi:hypothetical protein